MSLPYYGGMRHIHTTSDRFDQACGEIRRLSDEDVGRVLEFIYGLKRERGDVTGKAAGNPELLVGHAGKFSFNAGETETLLKMVLEARETVSE
ncbi:MAG: hypothetical protein ABFD46_02045 [Armatimonadota bacterium]